MPPHADPALPLPTLAPPPARVVALPRRIARGSVAPPLLRVRAIAPPDAWSWVEPAVPVAAPIATRARGSGPVATRAIAVPRPVRTAGPALAVSGALAVAAGALATLLLLF